MSSPLSSETMMKLMAYADGELEGKERLEAEKILLTDEHALRFVEQLSGCGNLVGEGYEASKTAKTVAAFDIADAVIPLGVVAVDLNTGDPVVLERGPLRIAVQASASLPGIFPPVELDGRLLCDLGVVASLPARLARKLGPTPVIAVDVASRLKPVECATALDVLMRMLEIGESMFRDELRSAADLLIEPAVGDIHWADFSRSESLIQIGRDAAREVLRDFRPYNHWYQRIWTLGKDAVQS